MLAENRIKKEFALHVARERSQREMKLFSKKKKKERKQMEYEEAK